MSLAVCLNWKKRVGVMEKDKRKQEEMEIQHPEKVTEKGNFDKDDFFLYLSR